MTELTDIVGKHMLDAVDFSTEQVEPYEGASYTDDASVCRFRLDGIVYVAAEDPDDGYRSSMRGLFIQDDAKLANVFPPIEVIGSHRTKGRYSGEDDVLELRDAVTGKVVLEVGTDNVDDYYPGFVASFHPENMAINGGSMKPANQNYLAYDVTVLEREFADLIAAFPELAEDETLRADTIEGETDAHRVLARILAIERDADSMAKAIADRQKDLAGRRSRQDRRKKAMRALMFRLMKAGGLTKVPLAEATVSIGRKAAAVEIVDETALPKKFCRVTVAPDRVAIKAALDAGKNVKGARMGEAGETLSVRAA